MREAALPLGFDAAMAVVSSHAHNTALETRFGQAAKLAVVESCPDGLPAAAFFHKPAGLWICNSRASPDGKMRLDALVSWHFRRLRLRGWQRERAICINPLWRENKSS
jgi:hypothetical protein